MRKGLKIVLIIIAIFVTILLLPLFWGIWAYHNADMKKPNIEIDTTLVQRQVHNGYWSYADSRMRQSESGLWELYLQGDPIERGLAIGGLTKELMLFQEDAFIEELKALIPSEKYMQFLRYMLIVFNYNLGEHIIPEYREEVYGLSFYTTHKYDDLAGEPYVRQLNYQGAHDIGHAMQNFMLVGCSSFAAWGSRSEDSTLIVGRNFDFYMGDLFSQNKVVTFCVPDSGYRYCAVSWAGMVGVVSGMNEHGITVTINAAKSNIPVASATPISILAREILQYACTIDEAYAIAQKRKTFVSESLLIGSGKERRAAIIEKSPHEIALFTTDGEQIISTNHYQSSTFANNKHNLENIRTSDSPARYARLEELLEAKAPISTSDAAAILRDRYGVGNADLGMCNEMSINQFIAHHAVIFKPEQGLMWVSSAPWQLGKMVAYDLNKIFADTIDFSDEIYIADLTIAADTFMQTDDYQQLLSYKQSMHKLRQATTSNTSVDLQLIMNHQRANPNFFYTYELIGNYYYSQSQADSAIFYWQTALQYPKKLSDQTKLERKLQKNQKK